MRAPLSHSVYIFRRLAYDLYLFLQIKMKFDLKYFNIKHFLKSMQNFTHAFRLLDPTALTQLSSSCKSFLRVILNNMRRRCGRGKSHISWKLLFIGGGLGAISISLCRRPADPPSPFTLSPPVSQSV